MAEQGLKPDLSKQLLDWYDAHARVLPWREKQGVPPDPYKVWLSEIMLQQTTVAAVKDYYLKFVSFWPRVEDLAAADPEDIMKAWAGLGYYARARNLLACAKAVAAAGGKFPSSLEGLQALPSIGPYTSGAIGAIAFDLPVAAVDGNVERVISRYYAIETPLPASKPEIRDKAQALVPAQRAGDFAQAMMDLGATICTPKSPDCKTCPWTEHCLGRAKGLAASLPLKAKKVKVPTRYGHVFWIENAEGDVLVRKRPAKGLLGGMTEFPSSDWGVQTEFVAPFRANWRKMPRLVEHTFTHFHLQLAVWRAVAPTAVLDGRFVSRQSLHEEALPSVMRKVAVVAFHHDPHPEVPRKRPRRVG
ncbi:MAG: A/G-specific adenine glycosylase [Alphaproteobacteria bacterium]|nr:A/G-specific adenine glycosylase [Alphaproteobacteria bacterium]